MPKTLLGKISAVSLAVMFASFALMEILVLSGQRGGDTFLDNPYLFICGFLMGLGGVSALFTGLAAIVKSKERSRLVNIAVIIGFFLFFSW